MVNKKVYLAGPISGTNYEECSTWRELVSEFLTNMDLLPYSPTRGKVYLSKEDKINDPRSDLIISSINIRDYNDVITSGAILVNLLGSKRVSIGTVMEIAWARMKQIPIVLVMEKEGNIHDHGMLTYDCIRVEKLEDGMSCIVELLLP